MRFYPIEIYGRTTAQEDSLTESLSFSRIMGVSEITSSETVRITSTEYAECGAKCSSLRNTGRFRMSSGTISFLAPSLVHYSAV